MKRSMWMSAAAVVAIAAGGMVARASSVIDFSSPGNYDLSPPDTLVDGSSDSATVVNIGGAHGNVVQLQLKDASTTGPDWVDASVKCLGTFGTVSQTATDGITYESYIQSATGNVSQTQAPYAYLGVDQNNNGVWDGSAGGDALIIQWDSIGTPVYQDWFTDGFDGTTRVHVWKNNANLINSVQIGDLATMDAGSGTNWGDLNVVAIYVGAGTWNADSFDYTAYVDNVRFAGAASPVPLPSAAWGGLMLMGMMGTMVGVKRLRKQPA